MNDDAELELRRLVEDYRVFLQLGKHENIAKLATKISVQLIGLCDDDLQNQNESTDLAESKNSALLVVVDRLIRKLQEHSKIAEAYSDVLEFVRVLDLVCFSQLVGSIPKLRTRRKQQAIDLEELSKILRKSIFLLRTTSPKGLSASKRDEVRIKKERLSASHRIGFSRCTIDLSDLIERQSSSNYQQPLQLAKLDELLDVLDPKWSEPRTGPVAVQELQTILLSEWFRSFVRDILDKSFPLDRFTLLVAILIVGDQCEHSSLGHLIGQLIDQVFHQETNSCSEEELLQLKQVGSFWLSHYKRFKATYKQTETGANTLANFFREADEFDDETQWSVANSLGGSPPAERLATDATSQEVIAAARRLPDLKPTLRRLIDEELLSGCECQHCGFQSNDLLAPLNSPASCEKCHNGPSLFCSLSYKQLHLISLDCLVSERLNLGKLIAFTISEWTRHTLAAANVRLFAHLSPDRLAGRLSERVDVGENFERLTMVRNGERGHDSDDNSSQGSSSNESESEREGGGKKDEESDDEEEGNGDGDGADCGRRDKISCLRMLAAFARSQAATNGDAAERRPVGTFARKSPASESLEMLRFAGREATNALAVCQSDALVFDASGDSLCLRLAARQKSGRLLYCSSRSPQSRLMFGCGRLFDLFELVRATGQDGATMGAYLCPHCECQLEELRGLDEYLAVAGAGASG